MKYLSLGLFIDLIPYVVMIIILKYYYDKRRLFMLGNRLPGPRPWPIIGNALEFSAKNVGKYINCYVKKNSVKFLSEIYMYTAQKKKIGTFDR